MKVVICGSINFPEKMKEVEQELKQRGHEVVIPCTISLNNIQSFDDAQKLKGSKEYLEKLKIERTKAHFNEIRNGDAILVVNVEKRGIPNYIGGATLSEIMFALYFDKKIFLLNPIPTHEKLAFFVDEVEGVHPIVINGNLDLVK
jgi:hypothetical protein